MYRDNVFPISYFTTPLTLMLHRMTPPPPIRISNLSISTSPHLLFLNLPVRHIPHSTPISYSFSPFPRSPFPHFPLYSFRHFPHSTLSIPHSPFHIPHPHPHAPFLHFPTLLYTMNDPYNSIYMCILYWNVLVVR